MGKIDRKRTRCCNKYVCVCVNEKTFVQKYPWKDPQGTGADMYNKSKATHVHKRTNLADRRKFQDGVNKKRGIRVNKLPWD